MGQKAQNQHLRGKSPNLKKQSLILDNSNTTPAAKHSAASQPTENNPNSFGHQPNHRLRAHTRHKPPPSAATIAILDRSPEQQRRTLAPTTKTDRSTMDGKDLQTAREEGRKQQRPHGNHFAVKLKTRITAPVGDQNAQTNDHPLPPNAPPSC